MRHCEGGDYGHQREQTPTGQNESNHEQQVVEAKKDVLYAEAEIGNERACRPAVRRSVAGYGNAHQAVLLLEYYLLCAARPLNVGDRVMVGTEHGVDAVTNREMADWRRTRIEHHDLNACTPSRWRPYLCRNTGASGAVGFDCDVSRNRSREIT